MTSIELPDFDIEFTLPTSVNEMSQEDYLTFIQLLHQAGDFGWDETRLRLELLYALSPIERGSKPLKMESSCALVALSDVLSSLFETQTIDGKERRVPRVITPKSMVREFTFQGTKFYGPMDAMSTSSMSEFIQSFYAFQEYQSTRDESHLRKLAAILYRPGSQDNYLETGDYRKPFNRAQVQARADLFKELPKELLKAADYFYAGFQEFLMTQEVRVGSSDISLRPLFESATSKNESGLPGQGWVDVLFTLSESGVFGNVENTEKQNVWTIMSRLYQLHREKKEFEKKNKVKPKKR